MNCPSQGTSAHAHTHTHTHTHTRTHRTGGANQAPQSQHRDCVTAPLLFPPSWDIRWWVSSEVALVTCLLGLVPLNVGWTWGLS